MKQTKKTIPSASIINRPPTLCGGAGEDLRSIHHATARYSPGPGMSMELTNNPEPRSPETDQPNHMVHMHNSAHCVFIKMLPCTTNAMHSGRSANMSAASRQTERAVERSAFRNASRRAPLLPCLRVIMYHQIAVGDCRLDGVRLSITTTGLDRLDRSAYLAPRRTGMMMMMMIPVANERLDDNLPICRTRIYCTFVLTEVFESDLNYE